MNRAIHFETWMAAVAVLLAASAFFRFALQGYSYIAHTLVFIAAVTALHRLAPAKLWHIAAALISIGLIYFCVVELAILINARTDTDAMEKKYCIVLGAQVKGTQPSPSLFYRISGAQIIMGENADCTVIVSGGQGEGEAMSEAECMRGCLVEMGCDPERIIVEDKATSTLENLENSFDIIRALGDDPNGNVTIVSSSYHLCRAKSMAARLGVDAVGYSCAPGNPLLALNFFIREAFGMTHLWVFGE